jgi:hypothetical protein
MIGLGSKALSVVTSKKPVWMRREDSAEFEAGYRAARDVCDSRVRLVESVARWECRRVEVRLRDACEHTGLRPENV